DSVFACRNDSELTANIDSNRSTDTPVHDGQATGWEAFRMSTSNSCPHPVHLYSYNGMCKPRYTPSLTFVMLGLLAVGCGANAPERTPAAPATGAFESDLAFLRQHTEVVLLSDAP